MGLPSGNSSGIKVVKFLGFTVKVGTPTVEVLDLDKDGLVLRARGTSVPTDADAGYAKGCTFIKTNGSVATTVYLNEGSSTSADFNAIESSASTVTGVVAGAGLTGGGTEGTVTLDVANTDTNLTVSANSVDLSQNIVQTKELSHTLSVADSTTANTAGGLLALLGAKGTGTAAGGAVTLTSGASSNGTAVNPGASGALTLTIGAAGTATTGVGGAGGTIALLGAAGGASTGASSTGGAGSDISLTAGAGGNSSGGSDVGGAGGTIRLTSGAGGTGATAGKDGVIALTGVLLKKQGTPAAKTTDATLTAAEVLSGLITIAQGAAGTSSQTLPLATDLDAALPDAVANDCFDLAVINTSVVDAEDATIVTNTGWTLVGAMDFPAYSAAGSLNSSGILRLRKTGTGTWTAYRIA